MAFGSGVSRKRLARLTVNLSHPFGSGSLRLLGVPHLSHTSSPFSSLSSMFGVPQTPGLGFLSTSHNLLRGFSRLLAVNCCPVRSELFRGWLWARRETGLGSIFFFFSFLLFPDFSGFCGMTLLPWVLSNRPQFNSSSSEPHNWLSARSSRCQKAACFGAGRSSLFSHRR